MAYIHIYYSQNLKSKNKKIDQIFEKVIKNEEIELNFSFKEYIDTTKFKRYKVYMKNHSEIFGKNREKIFHQIISTIFSSDFFVEYAKFNKLGTQETKMNQSKL